MAMRQSRRYNILQILVSIVLSLSIASVGFGHRAGTIEQDQAMQAYISSGGSIWDLCVSPSPNGSQSHEQCEACRLIDATNLAQFTCLPQKHEYAGVSLAFLRAFPTGAVQHASTHYPVRAPPVFL